MATHPTDIANEIFNASGGKTLTRNGAYRRLNRATVTFNGVDLDLEYRTEGSFMPATADDPAEYPMAIVIVAYHMGGDITRLLSEDQLLELAERIEAEWRA